MADQQKISSLPEKPFALSIDEVKSKLSTTQDGLSDEERNKRLDEFGPNKLPEAEKESLLKRFFKHFHDVLIYVLLGAAVLTVILREYVDTAVILGVVIINAVIGFIQEGKAEKALEGIRNMLSLSAVVRRNGEWTELEAEKLVPGDVVRLRSGDRVPADLRLIETTNLRIEEAALTGESEPAEKNTEIVEENAGVGDRSCMAFSGTMVTGGRGVGIVVATGGATEIGRINKMISGVEKIATPLTQQMMRFGKALTVIIIATSVLLALFGYFVQGMELEEIALATIGFAVAAIPEGLPAIMTITLALGVQRMARRNAITRRLNAVETLGSVSVICSDKTGTLTRNEMTARHVVTKVGRYDVSGTGYKPEGSITIDDKEVTLDDREDLRLLIEVMAVCNDSEIGERDGDWKVTGEPTEGALRSLGHKVSFDHKKYERLASIPFESENKFMATLNKSPDGEGLILLKGAPDRLLDRCREQRGAEGEKEALDRDWWEKQIEELSSKGLRVLAAAAAPASDGQSELAMEDLEKDMVFLGVVGIIDPPRPEAIKAIRICREAGIRVKMITGDHKGTALAIGKEMGITDNDQAVTGAELEEASDEELRKIVEKTDIFARTSPEHKLRLVQALQANKEVVAMTGDGVNDAPALKRADVGVAMGIKGTEATKEAAEIVLADDNFITIERAVEEGRTIYDNLRKSILFILPTNGAQGIVVLSAIVMGSQLPLSPKQILWVNMVTAVTLALALAFEPSEPGLMKRPPRKSGESILNMMLLWRVALVSALVGGATVIMFNIMSNGDEDNLLARTIAVNTLVIGQVFYLFNSRFLIASSFSLTGLFSNKVAWIAVGAMAVFQAAFVYLPPMQRIFDTTAVPAEYWLYMLAIGAVIFVIVEIEKLVMRALGKTHA